MYQRSHSVHRRMQVMNNLLKVVTVTEKQNSENIASVKYSINLPMKGAVICIIN